MQGILPLLKKKAQAQILRVSLNLLKFTLIKIFFLSVVHESVLTSHSVVVIVIH